VVSRDGSTRQRGSHGGGHAEADREHGSLLILIYPQGYIRVRLPT
jgi:hypothetical protein